MPPVGLHDLRAGFLLLLCLGMLAFISLVAILGTVMRPVRWCDRHPAS